MHSNAAVECEPFFPSVFEPVKLLPHCDEDGPPGSGFSSLPPDAGCEGLGDLPYGKSNELDGAHDGRLEGVERSRTTLP